MNFSIYKENVLGKKIGWRIIYCISFMFDSHLLLLVFPALVDMLGVQIPALMDQIIQILLVRQDVSVFFKQRF